MLQIRNESRYLPCHGIKQKQFATTTDFSPTTQPESIDSQERLEQNRLLIDDLAIKASSSGSLDAGVFSGEEEIFAFDRTVSRSGHLQIISSVCFFCEKNQSYSGRLRPLKGS